MNAQDIQNSFEERQNAVHLLRELADETRGRELSQEESNTLETTNAAIDALDEKINEGLSQLRRESDAAKALDEFRSYGDLTIIPDSVKEEGSVNETEMFGKLLSGEIRSFESFASEKRDLVTSSATAGGNTVDDTMYDQIITKLENESAVIAAGATVINTAGGEDLLIPKTTTNPSGAIVSEGAGYGTVEPVFGQVTLGAFKYGNLIQVSSELAQDSQFDIMSYVSNLAGQGVARVMGTDFSNGSGSSKPKGIAQAATSFGTSASATTITAANIFEVWSTMPTQYKNADTKWLMSPGAEKLIRLLADSDGRYIWNAGLQAGTPANLIGYEVFTDSNLDAPTSGKRALVFAHMPSFFVRLAGGLNLATSADYAFNADLITIRATMRGDSDVVDTNGVGCLTQA
jgi:HK97 family phage major capsid protein